MQSGKVQLLLQTVGFVAGFMIWVLISALLPFIREDIPLSPLEIAWVTATPVVLGSVLRIPLGVYTNRFGARLMFLLSFLFLIVPVILLSFANSFASLILSGFFLGVGGAVFSIGVTSLPRYFPSSSHGLVNGIYGMGNIGTAVTTFSAPVLANWVGWRTAALFALGVILLYVLLILLMGDRKEERKKSSIIASISQVWNRPKVWFFSLFYFVTFGSFVAFTVYLPNFLVSAFSLDKVDAGLRTAGFIVLATLARPVGGWLADKGNPFQVLAAALFGLTTAGAMLSFSLNLPLFTVGSLLMALSAGIGNGAVFKLVPLHFSSQAGIVNGIVGMFGGLGGFFPPLVLNYVHELTGHYAIGFMALSEFALANLVLTLWLHYGCRKEIYE